MSRAAPRRGQACGPQGGLGEAATRQAGGQAEAEWARASSGGERRRVLLLKGLCSPETLPQHLGASGRPEAPAWGPWGGQKGAKSYVQNDEESSQLASSPSGLGGSPWPLSCPRRAGRGQISWEVFWPPGGLCACLHDVAVPPPRPSVLAPLPGAGEDFQDHSSKGGQI